MNRRFLIGSAVLVGIFSMVGGTALAEQRGGRGGAILQRMAEKRDQPSDPNPTRLTRPGTYRFHFTHDGLKREYLVHVPVAALGKRAPMLLALHGGGGDMDYQASNYGLMEKSDRAGFIAVFPSGYSRLPGGVLGTWNAGLCCGQAAKRGIDDVGFLRAVIARVSGQIAVDPRRIFATGMSNGAMMSYRLACEAPEIRAIAPVAGTDGTSACKPARPVPVIHFHARDDSHVAFNGGPGPDSLVKANFVSVPATIAKWVALNQAAPTPRTVLTVPGASCVRHDGRAPVELCVTEGGGHSWPGSNPRRKDKAPSQAISANDRMWAFFSAL